MSEQNNWKALLEEHPPPWSIKVWNAGVSILDNNGDSALYSGGGNTAAKQKLMSSIVALVNQQGNVDRLREAADELREAKNDPDVSEVSIGSSLEVEHVLTALAALQPEASTPQQSEHPFVKWAKNHYWDNLEKDRDLIVKHIEDNFKSKPEVKL